MISFDKNGNIQPIEIIPISFEDFKKFFVDAFPNSATRENIFNNYKVYIEDFKKEVTTNFTQWVNGSYTTNKENPNDIDLVSLITWTAEENKSLPNFLTKGGSKEKYLVDGYCVPIYPEDDPRIELTNHLLGYWSNWFSTDREERRKGLIQLSF